MVRNFPSARLAWLLLSLVAVSLSACGKSDSSPPAAAISSPGASSATGDAETLTEPVQVRADGPSTSTPATPAAALPPAAPEVVLETTLGSVRIRLFPDKAPLTVDNFLANYVDRGFYNQTIVHFVEKGFIIAAGGFQPDFQPAEPRAYVANEAHNGLKNTRGTVAMSRDPEHINSANCQFFINVGDNAAFDHQNRDDAAGYGYCVFGEVIEGMEIVDLIAEVPTTDRENFPSTPSEPVIIASARRAASQTR